MDYLLPPPLAPLPPLKKAFILIWLVSSHYKAGNEAKLGGLCPTFRAKRGGG